MKTTNTHVVLPRSDRKPRPGAQVVGPANPSESVSVTLKLCRKEPLPQLATRPKTPLSREQLADKYGASPEHVATTRAVMEKLGLTVVSADAGTRSVKVAGPVSAMEWAFRVRLLHYEDAAEHFRGRVGPVYIPAELEGIVVGVFGLDNRRMVHRRNRRAPSSQALTAATAAGRTWFTPAELATIYDFPQADGAGEVIGLLEFGGGYFRKDLVAFINAVGATPGAEIIPIGIDHVPTNQQDGVEAEVMLDIEIVAALCPKATIPVYFAEWTEKGWLDILDAAIHDSVNKPTVLSISYGLAEGGDIWTAQALDLVDEALQEAAQLGITVCVAAGDDGADAQVGDGYAHVNFPASSPHVLAVGGTNLSAPDRKNRQNETAWWQGNGLRKDHGGSTGGGISDHFPRPAWQTAEIPSVNPHSTGGRYVPDVAAVANFASYLLVVDGSSEPNGGTSAATPLWASLIVLINALLVKAGKSRLGFAPPLFYGGAAGSAGTVGSVALFDVISGNNSTAAGVGGYASRSGFDCLTGWGSPIGSRLLAQLQRLL